MEKRYGKITSAKIGVIDGYARIHFCLSGKDWDTNDRRTTLDPETVKHNDRCVWSESDRDNDLAQIWRYISKLLNDANVPTVEKLINIPIEATFEGRLLKEWRVLTEVL